MQLLPLSIPSERPCKDLSCFDHLHFPLYVSLLALVSLSHQMSPAWSSPLIAVLAFLNPATLPFSFLRFEMIHLCRSSLEMEAVSSEGLIAPCTGEAQEILLAFKILKVDHSSTESSPAQVLHNGPICRAAHDVPSATLGQLLAGRDVSPNEGPWPWEGSCRDW